MSKVTLDRLKAHQVYKVDGVPVDGVTTVLKVINKPALMHWAWQMGKDGLDYRRVADKAADVGTIAHFLIECYLSGDTPDLGNFAPVDVTKAKECFNKFLDFWKQAKLKWIASETQLVSITYRFGGTLDIIAKDSKGYVLIDIKTSKAIYDEYWFQVAAYEYLWNEKFPKKPIKRTIICRIGKDGSDFQTQEKTMLTAEWQVFAACLTLTRLLKERKK